MGGANAALLQFRPVQLHERCLAHALQILADTILLRRDELEVELSLLVRDEVGEREGRLEMSAQVSECIDTADKTHEGAREAVSNSVRCTRMTSSGTKIFRIRASSTALRRPEGCQRCTKGDEMRLTVYRVDNLTDVPFEPVVPEQLDGGGVELADETENTVLERGALQLCCAVDDVSPRSGWGRRT